jgi:hypothetical protein
VKRFKVAIGWPATAPPAKCEIATSNPVINAQVGGNIWFGSGPYKSLDDVKLARSTIHSCPAMEEPPAVPPDNEDKSN